MITQPKTARRLEVAGANLLAEQISGQQFEKNELCRRFWSEPSGTKPSPLRCVYSKGWPAPSTPHAIWRKLLKNWIGVRRCFGVSLRNVMTLSSRRA